MMYALRSCLIRLTLVSFLTLLFSYYRSSSSAPAPFVILPSHLHRNHFLNSHLFFLHTFHSILDFPKLHRLIFSFILSLIDNIGPFLTAFALLLTSFYGSLYCCTMCHKEVERHLRYIERYCRLRLGSCNNAYR